MSKYDAIREVLRFSENPRVTMTFEQIEGIVPGGLPESAYSTTTWWLNEDQPSHEQSLAWFQAGYRVEQADLDALTVTFVQGGEIGEQN